MTRQDCIKALQKSAEADGFITMAEICRFIGIKKREYVQKYVEGLPRFEGKRYFIPEVADRIMSRMEQKGAAR